MVVVVAVVGRAVAVVAVVVGFVLIAVGLRWNRDVLGWEAPVVVPGRHPCRLAVVVVVAEKVAGGGHCKKWRAMDGSICYPQVSCGNTTKQYIRFRFRTHLEPDGTPRNLNVRSSLRFHQICEPDRWSGSRFTEFC